MGDSCVKFGASRQTSYTPVYLSILVMQYMSRALVVASKNPLAVSKTVYPLSFCFDQYSTPHVHFRCTFAIGCTEITHGIDVFFFFAGTRR